MLNTRKKLKLHHNISEAIKPSTYNYSSARHLISSLDPKSLLNDSTVSHKYKRSKKIIFVPQKFPVLIPSKKSFNKLSSFSSMSPSKSKKKLIKRPKTSTKSIFECTEYKKSTPITVNRLNTLAKLSGSPIMKSFDKLIRSCSEVFPTHKSKFVKERKRIRKHKFK